MRVLQALSRGDLTLRVELLFDEDFQTSDFSFGILSLEKKGRSLYLDASNSYTSDGEIIVHFVYDEDVLAPDLSTSADLRMKDLFNLHEAKFYIGEDDYTEPKSITLIGEMEDMEFRINLTID